MWIYAKTPITWLWILGADSRARHNQAIAPLTAPVFYHGHDQSASAPKGLEEVHIAFHSGLLLTGCLYFRRKQWLCVKESIIAQ